MTVQILKGDCRDVLATLPDESVHCVVTSPPYWGLRDYGTAGQLGLESSPAEYVEQMVAVFMEVRRVLRDDGTLWLNMGDSYASGEIGRHDGKIGRHPSGDNCELKEKGRERQIRRIQTDLKPKDLCGIPWRVAFALQADGWYLRQDIIWSKPNPMPESVTDRCTKAHEYIFLLSKRARYYYDAEAIREEALRPEGPGKVNPTKGAGLDGFETRGGLHHIGPSNVRNKRSVWEVATAPFSEAHFATFPPALIEPCILAGCPEKACAKCGAPWVRQIQVPKPPADVFSHSDRPDAVSTIGTGKERHKVGMGGKLQDWRDANPPITTGRFPSCSCNAGTVPSTVLDPFGGAGTTGLVADRLGRNALLIELNLEYAAMAERRITDDAPLFVETIVT